MTFISSSLPATINVEDIAVTIEPDESDTLTIKGGETVVDFTVPAGCFRVKIKNAGIAGAGAETTAQLQIGADTISLFPGDFVEWKYKRDTVTGRLKTLPEIEVVTNGAEIWYNYEQ
ncbi:MAG: hypothetical protein KDC34_19045 [Saprospiraceae bacterium]|nr:hypothetical protein [Saprospiraceae bacterium]